jgi:hypothetical protein
MAVSLIAVVSSDCLSGIVSLVHFRELRHINKYKRGLFMKIFISWSGERSQQVAEALREWLPLVLHYSLPWLSKSDIEAGERWSVEVAKELQESNFGIICVTKDNLSSPWILFESGALAKSMDDGRVIPLLLDLDFKEISGPLAQFQAKKADQNNIRELVLSLNRAAQTPVPDDRLAKLFDTMYAQLGEKIAAIPASGQPTTKARAQEDILEELVSGVRSVEMRVRDLSDHDEPMIRRKLRRRFHPEMIFELSHMTGRGRGDPIMLLVVASLFRDEMPWLYELAAEAYRAINSGNKLSAKRAIEQYRNAMKMASSGRMMDMLGIGMKDTHFMMREALEFIPDFFDDFEDDSLPEATKASDVTPPRRRRKTTPSV